MELYPIIEDNSFVLESLTYCLYLLRLYLVCVGESGGLLSGLAMFRLSCRAFQKPKIYGLFKQVAAKES